MTWLIEKLALPFVAPALLAALLASVGGLGLTWWHLSSAVSDRDKTITERTGERDSARLELAQTQTALAHFHAQVEMDRADANAKALEAQKSLQSQITDLTSRLAVAQRARQAASDQILKVLHAIPPEQQAAISPSVRDALCRVRVQQAVADATACGASGSGPNPP